MNWTANHSDASAAVSTFGSSALAAPGDSLQELLEDLAEADRADNRLLSLVLSAAAATLLLAAASSLGL
ncbi:MAG: hypothetical protein ACOVOT_05765 [Rubrivivax sp.]|jgi:hypothetical protein|nr:hypothetical protein [Rubrivivax sp.]